MLKARYTSHYRNSEILDLIRKCFNFIFLIYLSRRIEKGRERFSQSNLGNNIISLFDFKNLLSILAQLPIIFIVLSKIRKTPKNSFLLGKIKSFITYLPMVFYQNSFFFIKISTVNLKNLEGILKIIKPDYGTFFSG